MVDSFVGFHEDSKNRRRSMWRVKCNCGEFKIVKGGSLTSGQTISCGCALKEQYIKMRTKTIVRNRKATGVHAFNLVLNSYKQRSKKLKLNLELSNDEFRVIMSSNCYYCGLEPLKVSPNKSVNSRVNVNGVYMYNGIDRLNSSLGYDVKNCVPCCEICNKAKRDLSIEEFKGG